MADEPKQPEETGIWTWTPENIDKMPGRRIFSLYINRFHVLVSGSRTRIVFGESIVGEDDANWYTAITLLNADAVALAETILQISKASEEQEQTASGEKQNQ